MGTDYYFIDRTKGKLVHIGRIDEFGGAFREQKEYGIVRNSDWIQFLFGKTTAQIAAEASQYGHLTATVALEYARKYTIVNDDYTPQNIRDLVLYGTYPSFCDGPTTTSDEFLDKYMQYVTEEDDKQFAYSYHSYTIQVGQADALIDDMIMWCPDTFASKEKHIKQD